METKRSRIYLAAWVAAEKELPPESKSLIDGHDRLFAGWRAAGFPQPIPKELLAAEEAIEADPLASIPFYLRRKTNQEGHKEYREQQMAINCAPPASEAPYQSGLSIVAPEAGKESADCPGPLMTDGL